MNIPTVLYYMALACVIWAVVSAVLLTAALDRRGIKTPFPFIGALIFRNIVRYREVTLKETGAVGGLFFSYVIPMNAAWILALAAWLIQGRE